MYKVIPEFPMYMANEDGEILSLYSNKKRKAWVGRDGYPRITLWRDGKQYTIEVHRLVASAFLEQPEGRTEIHHRNHNKEDNRVVNLE
jgi:hypothetical protein